MSNVAVEEKADGTINIGGILIDASLISDDIKAILRQNINPNWVSDATLTPALNALSGTTYEAIYNDMQKIDSRDCLNLIQEAFLAAAGGTKPLASGTAVRPPNSVRNTVFAKDEGRSWNTTAMALLGHILISTKANTRASELFLTKYKAEDIWDMKEKAMDRGVAENSDIFIKVQMAKRFPKSPAHFKIVLATTIAKMTAVVGNIPAVRVSQGAASAISSSSSSSVSGRTTPTLGAISAPGGIPRGASSNSGNSPTR